VGVHVTTLDKMTSLLDALDGAAGSGFLNLREFTFGARWLFVEGTAVLCKPGSFKASLASTYQMR